MIRHVRYLAATVFLLSVAGHCVAQQVGADDFDIAPELAWCPEVIYNPIDDEYFLSGGNKAIRLDGAEAKPVDAAFEIPVPEALRSARVVHNLKWNEYFVLASVRGGSEITGQRMAKDGAALGAPVVVNLPGELDSPRIEDRFVGEIEVCYNTVDNQYLAVWGGVVRDAIDEEKLDEVLISRVLGADGSSAGPRRVFTFPTEDGETGRRGPGLQRLCYSSAQNEYFAVWQEGKGQEAKREIHGQRMQSDGSLVGENIQISFADGSHSQAPDIAHNSRDDRYCVVWRGAEANGVHAESEGRMIDCATGELLGEGQFKISNIESCLDDNVWSMSRRVVHNPDANEFLVAWWLMPGNWEIHAQRISTDGEQIGANDFPVSAQVKGGESWGTLNPAVGYNSKSREYLITWCGGSGFRAFGQRYRRPDGPATQILQISLTETVATIEVQTEPEISYAIETSSDLANWERLDARFLGTGGAELFSVEKNQLGPGSDLYLRLVNAPHCP